MSSIELHIDPVTVQDRLDELCNRWASADFLTIDTEFLRESTYYPKLCLIQVADEQGAWAVDPLAEGINLDAFWDLMAAPAPLKVFHACRQDLEIFLHQSGRLPEALFDTQVAAMVCGFGESVGYETLVSQITKAKLDKTARFTDWSRRPLSERQIEYALGDVTHLRKIYQTMHEQLEQSGRGPWLDEEMSILTNPQTYVTHPEEAWEKIKTRSSKPRFLAIVRELAAWREREAQTSDLPRNRVARDEVLLELAANPPAKPEDLDRVRGLSKGYGRSRQGQTLIEAVTRAQDLSKDDLPEPVRARPLDKAPPVAELLKVLLRIRCQQEGVAPKLIANGKEIEALARGHQDGLTFMDGWRFELYGRQALALMRGEIGLAAKDGEIIMVESASNS